MEEVKTAVSINNFSKKFKGFTLDVPCLKIPQGFATALIGENGAGKTTFMRMLLGLSKPTKGEIQLFGKKGKEMNQERSRIGSIIETPAFITRLSAYDNLMLRADLLGLKDKKKAILRR